MYFFKKKIFKIISKVLNLLGYSLIKKEKFFLINIEKFKEKTSDYSAENFINFITENKSLSKSQIFQDLFVDVECRGDIKVIRII